MAFVLQTSVLRLIGMTAVLPILLSACAVDKQGCDPGAVRSAGLFTKVSCDVSGSYEARAQDQQADLAQAQARNRELQDIVAQLESQNRDLSQGLTVEKARRDRLVRSLNGYLAQLDQLAAENALLKKQIAQTRADADRLSSLSKGASAQQQQVALQKVQKQIQTLRAMVP